MDALHSFTAYKPALAQRAEPRTLESSTAASSRPKAVIPSGPPSTRPPSSSQTGTSPASLMAQARQMLLKSHPGGRGLNERKPDEREMGNAVEARKAVLLDLAVLENELQSADPVKEELKTVMEELKTVMEDLRSRDVREPFSQEGLSVQGRDAPNGFSPSDDKETKSAEPVNPKSKFYIA